MGLNKLEFQDVRILLFQTLGWGAPHNNAYCHLTGPHRNDLRNKNKFFQSRRNWMSTNLQINLLNPLSLVSKIPMSSPFDKTLTVKFVTPLTFLIIFFFIRLLQEFWFTAAATFFYFTAFCAQLAEFSGIEDADFQYWYDAQVAAGVSRNKDESQS